PILGPEMKSTGEVIGTGETFGEAYAKAQSSAGTALPVRGRIFVSVHDQDKDTMLPLIKDFHDMGFQITATRGTAQYLFDNGIFAEVILKIHEGRPNVVDHMRSGRIDLLINTPLGIFSQKGDEMIRIEAVRRRVPYTTTTSAAWAATQGIRYLLKKEIKVRPLSDKTIMV
ncbi:MAG: carbamoyl phosphate synthase large subunit, partial [Spirochaetales bacterium]|nr:carbamoyl phosphate synthase large subunit [Spirochaetales bacterium]